jgi:hypothetical protein
MESEPSSESFVCTFSQFDESSANVDLMMSDDKFEGNPWEFETPCSSHSTKNKSQGNKSWSWSVMIASSQSMEVQNGVELWRMIGPFGWVLPVLSTSHITIFDISSSVGCENHFPVTTILPYENEVSISQTISFDSSCLQSSQVLLMEVGIRTIESYNNFSVNNSMVNHTMVDPTRTTMHFTNESKFSVTIDIIPSPMVTPYNCTAIFISSIIVWLSSIPLGESVVFSGSPNPSPLMCNIIISNPCFIYSQSSHHIHMRGDGFGLPEKTTDSPSGIEESQTIMEEMKIAVQL